MKATVILLLLCCAVLAACSKESETNSTQTEKVTKESGNHHPTKLIIERKGKLQSVTNQPPAQYDEEDVKLVKQIYESLFHFEVVPKDAIIHCPIDYGISYDLVFYDNEQQILFANVEAGGCQFLHQGKAAYRTDDAFWKLMQEATEMNKAQLWGAPGSF